MDEEKQELREESRGLTFKDILFILRKHWIAIVAFLMAGLVGGVVFDAVYPKVKPQFTSTGTMLVSYQSDNTSTAITTDYNFSNYITNTYIAFIKEDAVLSKAAEKLNAPETYEKLNKPLTKYYASSLRGNLSVSANSLILKVSYTANDRDDAKTIVDVIIGTASEVADSPKVDPDTGNPVLDKDGNEVPKYRFLNGNLTPVSDAKTGTAPNHRVRDLALGVGVGVVLALLYVFIREISDNTFKSSEEIERSLNIPVLAGIPDYHFDDEKKGGK